MADLEEVDYFDHCHLVVLFLLLNKHVLMFSRKGIEEIQVTFLLGNFQFKIGLEIVIQLGEDLEANVESLWGHIVWLLKSPL